MSGVSTRPPKKRKFQKDGWAIVRKDGSFYLALGEPWFYACEVKDGLAQSVAREVGGKAIRARMTVKELSK